MSSAPPRTTRARWVVPLALVGLAGCSAVHAVVRPIDEPPAPHDGEVWVYEGDATQPVGFHPIALLRVEGESFGSRSRLVDELVRRARQVGCTDLFVSAPYHQGPYPRAVGVCGVVEPHGAMHPGADDAAP